MICWFLNLPLQLTSINSAWNCFSAITSGLLTHKLSSSFEDGSSCTSSTQNSKISKQSSLFLHTVSVNLLHGVRYELCRRKKERKKERNVCLVCLVNKPRAQSTAVSQGQVYESTHHNVSGNRDAKLDDYLLGKFLMEREFKSALSECLSKEVLISFSINACDRKIKNKK